MKRFLALLLVGFAGCILFSAVAEEPEKEEEEAPEQKSETGKPSKEILQELQKKARERIADDARYYSSEEREEIIKLYTSWKSKKSKEREAIVLTLQRRFPRANLTGCITFRMALSSSRSRQIKLLQQVIKNYNDSWYGNGVQIGPLARYYLIIMLMQDGKKAEAKKYRDELETSYPNALYSSQTLLSHQLAVKLAPYDAPAAK